LRPVEYYNILTKRHTLGLIAHEVQEQIPFIVTGEKDGEDTQSINYSGLISVLIHEMQELKDTIRTLSSRIETLEKQTEH